MDLGAGYALSYSAPQGKDIVQVFVLRSGELLFGWADVSYFLLTYADPSGDNGPPDLSQS